jgi:hypothetical protein
MLNSEDAVAAVRVLDDNASGAKRILNRLLGILAGAGTFSIEFPISSQLERKLIQTMEDFRRRADSAAASVDLVMQRAADCQFTGEEIMEAVDCIVNVSVEEARQVVFGDVASVRSLFEKERAAHEKRKEKLHERIQKQRELVSQIQEKAAEREAELADEMERERREGRHCKSEWEKEKHVREELMRVIEGEAVDFDFLRCQLKADEMKAVLASRE